MRLPKIVIDLVYPLAEFEVYAQRAIGRLLERQATTPNGRAVDGVITSISRNLTGAGDAMLDGSHGATWVTNCVAHPGNGSGFTIDVPGVSAKDFEWYNDLREKHGLKRAIRARLRKELRKE